MDKQKQQTILHGCSLYRLKELADNSVDSVVTDPPYGLAFMGKKWDYDVPSIELWREVLRVLKPGGHLLSFGGTRTYHRMVVNIEDAGFEIRDSIMWHMGSGFPKSYNLKKGAIKKGVACECETPEYEMRSLQSSNLSQTIDTKNKSREVLQPILSQQNLQECRTKGAESKIANGKESCLERREIHRADEGICDGKDAESSKGESKRICFRAHFDRGKNTWTFTQEWRSCSPQKSQSSRQSTGKFTNIQKSQRTLDETPLPRCSKCEKYIFPEGFGSALKPATEIIAMARKPLSEKNIVNNVLKWGTGALNIDGCRVGTDVISTHGGGDKLSGLKGKGNSGVGEYRSHLGRFPANIILDEEAGAALDEQSGILKPSGSTQAGKAINGGHRGIFGESKKPDQMGHNDYGGASRFFYCAKASKSERNAGLPKDQPCSHPTVKPIKLMQYLVRLVTPPGGKVLDPFMGSGTTGIACKKEGFGFVGIEREIEYVEIASRRIEFVQMSLFG